MAQRTTCDLCGNAIADDEPTVVRVDATTFGPGEQPEGLPPTPQAVATDATHLDFHIGCWPTALAQARTKPPARKR